MELDAHAIQTQNVLMCIRHWHCRGESDSCNTLHSLVRAGGLHPSALKSPALHGAKAAGDEIVSVAPGEHTPPGGRVFHKQPPKV